MKIKYKNRFKSIGSFNDTEIEEFSIVLGLNGSGKTHLLQAINSGNVICDKISVENITYFDLQNFLIKNQKSFTLGNLDGEKTNAWNTINNPRIRSRIENYDLQIKEIVGNIENPYQFNKNIEKIDKYNSIVDTLKQYINNSVQGPQNKIKKLIYSGIFQSGKYYSDLSKNDFIKSSTYDPDEYELLESLSELFIDYHKKILIAKLPKKDGGLGLRGEKLKIFMNNAPWIFLNRMFESFGLQHKVDYPDLNTADLLHSHTIPYQVKLLIKNDIIDFEDLSSGEKILCALAVTVYQEEKSTFPELLLLDEIDALLHPSMIQNLLKVINEVFIKEGCKIILATHSPTTVALVDDKSLFEIQKGTSLDKIRKINKFNSINKLSEGFITLERGLKIFDEIFKKELTIISEGKNYDHIKKAISILDKNLSQRIQFYKQDTNTGDADLFGLFEFIKLTNIENKVLFIWDCDAMSKVNKKSESDNIFKYCFELNTSNSFTKKGIENLYEDKIFTEEFLKQVSINDRGTISSRCEFSSDSKNEFLTKILRLRNKDHFNNYKPLITKINEIL